MIQIVDYEDEDEKTKKKIFKKKEVAKGFGFCCFSTDEEARKALQLNNKEIPMPIHDDEGENEKKTKEDMKMILRVSYAQTKEERRLMMSRRNGERGLQDSDFGGRGGGGGGGMGASAYSRQSNLYFQNNQYDGRYYNQYNNIQNHYPIPYPPHQIPFVQQNFYNKPPRGGGVQFHTQPSPPVFMGNFPTPGGGISPTGPPPHVVVTNGGGGRGGGGRGGGGGGGRGGGNVGAQPRTSHHRHDGSTHVSAGGGGGSQTSKLGESVEIVDPQGNTVKIDPIPFNPSGHITLGASSISSTTASMSSSTTNGSFLSLSMAERKQYLGELLFPSIQKIDPANAGKITGMIIELDMTVIINLLHFPSELVKKVEEAQKILKSANMEEHN
jgi:hypothetical protein